MTPRYKGGQKIVKDAPKPPVQDAPPPPPPTWAERQAEERRVMALVATTPVAKADDIKDAPWQEHEHEIDELELASDLLNEGSTSQVEVVDNLTVTNIEGPIQSFAQTPGVAGESSPRAALLREAESLITGDRNQTYGSPTENFENIANLWNVQFDHLLKPGVHFTGAHVAQAMIHVKQARLIAQPKRDNYLDIAGYAACGWEVEGS